MSKRTAPQESSHTLEVARQLFPFSREQILTKFKERPGFQIVEKPVPFARDLTQFILFRGIQVDQQVRPFVTAYRGFDLNRRGDNLATMADYGTGFEGYGIGRYGSGEDIVKEIAECGKKEITYLKRMYPQTWRTIMREVWDAVEGRRVTARSLDTLNRMLVNCISNGRQRIKYDSTAQRFRENTEHTVSAAPEVGFYYDETTGQIMCVYMRAVERRRLPGVSVSRFSGDPETLLASDQELVEGWRLMSKLGMLGQMVVRTAETRGYLNYGPGAMAEAIKANSGWR